MTRINFFHFWLFCAHCETVNRSRSPTARQPADGRSAEERQSRRTDRQTNKPAVDRHREHFAVAPLLAAFLNTLFIMFSIYTEGFIYTRTFFVRRFSVGQNTKMGKIQKETKTEKKTMHKRAEKLHSQERLLQ